MTVSTAMNAAIEMTETKFDKRKLIKTMAKFPIGSIFSFQKGLYKGVYYQVEKHLLWDCVQSKVILNSKPIPNNTKRIQSLSEARGPVVLTLHCKVLSGPEKGKLHGFSGDVLGHKHYRAKLATRRQLNG